MVRRPATLSWAGRRGSWLTTGGKPGPAAVSLADRRAPGSAARSRRLGRVHGRPSRSAGPRPRRRAPGPPEVADAAPGPYDSRRTTEVGPRRDPGMVFVADPAWQAGPRPAPRERTG